VVRAVVVAESTSSKRRRQRGGVIVVEVLASVVVFVPASSQKLRFRNDFFWNQDQMIRSVVVLLSVVARGGMALVVPSALESLYLRPYYALEQLVAGRSIPRIPPKAQRLTLKDTATTTEPTFDHSLWDGVLRAHVKDGLVDYEAMRRDERFEQYLKLLAESQVPRDDAERLAYYLNAYNALCASVVVRNPGIASILELSTAERPVWDQEVGTLAGVPVSLNQVEHERLRFQWDEPLIHACIVCASTSCPPLASAAFTTGGLRAAMQDRARVWLADPTKGCALDDRLTLSRIFLWFERDFADGGGPLAFVHTYATLGGGTVTVDDLRSRALRYFDYDWSLNSAPAKSHEGAL